MPISTTIKLTNPFQRLAAGITAKTDEATDEAAADVGNEYRLTARVDTGAQVASTYIVKTNGDSTYGEATSAASAMRPAAQMTPEQRPDAEHQAVVAVAVDYAYLNENGTDERAGDGAFVQAVEAARPRYYDRLRKAMNDNAK